MTGIKRNLENDINRLLDSFPVVLIVGARQVGKTTLARRCRPDWSYFDLEKGSDFDFISRDFDFFFRENKTDIIIDEAQELPELFKELRGVVDSDRKKKGRFILTGSSSPNLLSNVADSLAGRVAIVEVGTLKINEIMKEPLPSLYEIFKREVSLQDLEFLKEIKVSKIDVLNFFLQGGYPEPLLESDHDFLNRWMENYYGTYINRDVRKLFPKLDSLKYRRFIDTLAGMSGTIINKAQLGRSIDVSEVTIRDYLEIAHSTFIWRIIPSYEKSKSKSAVKMPKGIFRDSGLGHFLQGIHTREKLLKTRFVGTDFEGFVTEEIIKGIQSLGIGKWNYYYFRTKNGAEIDLIVEGNFGTIPIEIKFGSHTDLRQLTSIRNFVSDNGLPFGIVINNSSEIKMLCDSIIQIPSSCI